MEAGERLARGERVEVPLWFIEETLQDDGADAPAPIALIAPYLPLRATVETADWTLVAFDDWPEGSWGSNAQTHAEVARAIEALDPAIKEIPFGAVCVFRDLAVGEALDARIARPLSRALLAAMLDRNPRLDEHDTWCDCKKHGTTTSENAVVMAYPLHGGFIDIETGSRVKRTMTLLRDRFEDLPGPIPPPEALYLPDSAVDLDADYFQQLFERLTRGDPIARRLEVAISWLEFAASNGTGVISEVRVTALRSAFEVLLGSDRTAVLRMRVGELLDAPGAGRTTRTWADHGRVRSADLTAAEWWFQSFSLLRNAIVHGNPIEDEAWYFEGLPQVQVAQERLVDAIRAVCLRIAG